jgi:hypothetical protein
MAKILYKLTSRSRPNRLKETMLSIKNNASNPDYLICLTLDEDDKTVNNAEFTDWLNEYFGLELHYFFGKSKNKIDAINRDIEQFKVWDILVNVSDDQVFIVKGFDLQIQLAFTMFFPDYDGFVHFRDSNHNPIDALSTMSIIGIKYFERDSYIYHPSYVSVWCDNESQEVAKRRGRYKFIDSIIFEHLHPSYGKGPNDAQYQKTESKSVHLQDKRNFDNRKRKGFPV